MQGINSFVNLNRMLGLCPALSTSKNQIISVLPTLIALISFVLSSYSAVDLPQISDTVSIMVHLLQLVPNSISYLHWLITLIRNRNFFTEALAIIESIDRDSNMYCGTYPLEVGKCIKKPSVLITIVAVVLGLSVGAIQFDLQVNLQKVLTFFYWYCCFVPEFSLMLVTIQCSGWLFLLTKRAQQIKHRIRNQFSNSWESSEKHSTLVHLPLNDSVATKFFKNLPKILLEIQQCSSLISNYYGLQIALNYFSAFISSTAKLYFFILMIRFLSIENMSTDKTLKLLAYVLFLAMHLLTFGVSMWCGSSAKKHWKEVIFLLETVLSKSKNDDISADISHSLDIMTQNPLELNANDFFVMDFQVATGMMTSITTYLVILVQFQMDSKSSGDDDLTVNLLSLAPRKKH